jgi:putative transposase
MKKSRFSEQQIAFVLRQAEEGTPVVEVCRNRGSAGVVQATLQRVPDAEQRMVEHYHSGRLMYGSKIEFG